MAYVPAVRIYNILHDSFFDFVHEYPSCLIVCNAEEKFQGANGNMLKAQFLHPQWSNFSIRDIIDKGYMNGALLPVLVRGLMHRHTKPFVGTLL